MGSMPLALERKACRGLSHAKHKSIKQIHAMSSPQNLDFMLIKMVSYK